MMWGYYDGWSWFWMAGMMLVFWGGFIALAVWAIRAISGPRQGSDSAMATLRQRLASGQIDQEEFEKTRKILEG
jgi:putative membrane protein